MADPVIHSVDVELERQSAGITESRAARYGLMNVTVTFLVVCLLLVLMIVFT